MKTLLLILSLLPASALAQVGLCKAGAPCDVLRLRTTAPSGTFGTCSANAGTGSRGYLVSSTSESHYTFSDARCSVGASESWGSTSGHVFYTMGSFRAPIGAATAPTYTFSGDPDTGLYWVGSNQLGVATAGARSFNFNATAGRLEGTVSQAQLVLDNVSGSCLDYNASAGKVCAGNGTATVAATTVNVTQGASGVRYSVSNAATGWSMTTATAQVEPTGRQWWSDVTPTAARPPRDFAAGPHPVLERRFFGLDMGMESTATPTFYPIAPRVGGAAATVSVTDAAAAVSAVLGASPSQVDARGFVTAAAAGSRSYYTTTAYVRRVGAAPRWCQKVSIDSVSNVRVWLGLVNADPGASDNPANGAVTFRFSTSAGDSKWQACYANGVSTTCVDTAVGPSTGTGSYDLLCIDCREGLSTACTWWVNGVAKTRVTSGLPTGAPWFPLFSVEALAAAARTGYAGPMSVEVN